MCSANPLCAFHSYVLERYTSDMISWRHKKLTDIEREEYFAIPRSERRNYLIGLLQEDDENAKAGKPPQPRHGGNITRSPGKGRSTWSEIGDYRPGGSYKPPVNENEQYQGSSKYEGRYVR